MAEVKIFLSKIYSSQNVLELYIVKGFYNKHIILGDFSIKYKSFHLFVVVFLCIPACWESYMTPSLTAMHLFKPSGLGF